MLPPDLALAQLLNRAAQTYNDNPPVYMTYREHTHVSAPTLGRTQDIDRTVAVRVADNYALMHDLPSGGDRFGEAFPIIPYFDPISNFSFTYFANLKRVDITLDRGKPLFFTIPQDDPSATMTVPYVSFWTPRYAPDSRDDALHLLIDPTPRTGTNTYYPNEIVEDPRTQLPSRITMLLTGTDEAITLDYAVIDGHWIITHGTFSATQHAVFLAFKVIADITFDQFAFSTTPPDPRLAATAPTEPPSTQPPATSSSTTPAPAATAVPSPIASPKSQ